MPSFEPPRNPRPDAPEAAHDALAHHTLTPGDTERHPDRIQLSMRRLDHQDLSQAVSLFSATPGWEHHAEAFRHDAIQFIQNPPSAVIGSFMDNGMLVGVGCAVKEIFDFSYWTITWVMVDSSLRGQGIGAQIIKEIENYMQTAQHEFDNPNCRVLLSAIDGAAEKFYSRLGYSTLLQGPLEGECLMYRDLRGPGLRPSSNPQK